MKTTHGLDLAFWLTALQRIAEAFERNERRLCRLDAALGDGDHGTGMVLGLREARRRVEHEAPADIGALLRTVGSSFVSRVGGVTGVIFGTMLMSAGGEASGLTELSTRDLARMGGAALEAVRARGKVREGQKSMVDALAPAMRALSEAASDGVHPAEALARAAGGANAGAEATRELAAQVGRGRYQADRGVGHLDAGAASVALLLDCLSSLASMEENR